MTRYSFRVMALRLAVSIEIRTRLSFRILPTWNARERWRTTISRSPCGELLHVEGELRRDELSWDNDLPRLSAVPSEVASLRPGRTAPDSRLSRVREPFYDNWGAAEGGRRVMLSGRKQQCGILGRVAADARAGRSRRLVACGDPGIGKAALSYATIPVTGHGTALAEDVEADMELPLRALHQAGGGVRDRLEMAARSAMRGAGDGVPAAAGQRVQSFSAMGGFLGLSVGGTSPLLAIVPVVVRRRDQVVVQLSGGGLGSWLSAS
jgi:hypothetical protein